MGCNITQNVVDQAANELAELFKRNTRKMREAWEQTAGNLNVSLTCQWKPAEDVNAINADLGIKFKLAEVNHKTTWTFSDGFGPLFDQRPIPRGDGILWRSFADLREDLEDAAQVKAIHSEWDEHEAQAEADETPAKSAGEMIDALAAAPADPEEGVVVDAEFDPDDDEFLDGETEDRLIAESLKGKGGE